MRRDDHGVIRQPTIEELRAIRLAVVECPDRGSVLPVSRQSQGCAGAELTECHAGKGDPPGAVCLAACVTCQCEKLWP
jgi:hypothetical protein